MPPGVVVRDGVLQREARRIDFVDALPRTETGKLQRFKLRETAR